MSVIYIETTIPSYLTSNPSGDLIQAAMQRSTSNWWEIYSQNHSLYISELVIIEAGKGDKILADKRLKAIESISILKLNDDVVNLSRQYKEKLGLSAKAFADIMHISYAVSYEVEYLLTWNCKHIANPAIIENLVRLNDIIGRHTPKLITPQQFIEINQGDLYE